jgi:serine protease AprX
MSLRIVELSGASGDPTVEGGGMPEPTTSGLAEQEPESISQIHVDHVLQRRRQERRHLTEDLGAEIVDKLHPWLVGDLILDRREEELAKLFEEPVATSRSYSVMVNMAGARLFVDQPLGADPPDGRRRLEEREARVEKMSRAGELALSRLRGDLEQRGVTVEETYWLTQSAVVQLNGQQLEGVAARGDVASLTSLKREFVVCLDVSRPLIQADQVQAAGNTGAGTTVAIIDTGVDAAHPALAAVVGPQTDTTGTAVNRDDFGHGTHCAGIVASQDGTFIGIAPGAQLMDIRIMDAQGGSQPNWAVAGLTAAVNAAVDVASNSWGWSHANGAWVDTNGTCVLCTAADNAVAAGVCVVVAAGNEDNDTCSTYDTHIRCPGMANNVITVGASDDSDQMAGFSSIGPTPDGRTKPDVTAPGVAIASCQAAGTALGPVVAPGFVDSDGTSMACPHVAGVAALMLSVNNTVPPATIRTTIMTTAVDIGATPNEMGSGRVDALAAVNRTPAPG